VAGRGRKLLAGLAVSAAISAGAVGVADAWYTMSSPDLQQGVAYPLTGRACYSGPFHRPCQLRHVYLDNYDVAWCQNQVVGGGKGHLRQLVPLIAKSEVRRTHDPRGAKVTLALRDPVDWWNGMAFIFSCGYITKNTVLIGAVKPGTRTFVGPVVSLRASKSRYFHSKPAASHPRWVESTGGPIFRKRYFKLPRGYCVGMLPKSEPLIQQPFQSDSVSLPGPMVTRTARRPKVNCSIARR
jgi:hypothetical protein